MKLSFINEDYFPSKVAGGSAKSISLLKRLFEKNNIESEVLTSAIKQKEINEDNIYILNSIFGKTNRRSLLTLLLIRLKKSPRVIIIPRGELSPGAMSNRILLKTLYVLLVVRLINKLLNIQWVATSEEEKTNIINRIGNKTKIEICPNLINFDTKIIDSTDEVKNLVSIGRIEKKKNQLWLSNLPYQIDLIGPFSPRENGYKLKVTMAKNLNILGGRDPESMNHEYAKYRINLLPTLNENFGHVVIESILHGIPIIISKNTPWTNFINDYNLGFALDLDIDEWAEKIEIILNDIKLYKQNCIESINELKKLNLEFEHKWLNLIKQL